MKRSTSDNSRVRRPRDIERQGCRWGEKYVAQLTLSWDVYEDVTQGIAEGLVEGKADYKYFRVFNPLYSQGYSLESNSEHTSGFG